MSRRLFPALAMAALLAAIPARAGASTGGMEYAPAPAGATVGQDGSAVAPAGAPAPVVALIDAANETEPEQS